MKTNYTQNEVDQVFGNAPSQFVGEIPVSVSGSSYYINESNWADINASDRSPRQCDVHCCQMQDGTILAFDDYIPEDAESFNSDWIVSINPKTGIALLDHSDPYSCDILQILTETGAINKDGQLKSN